jgi:hypothetical protein
MDRLLHKVCAESCFRLLVCVGVLFTGVPVQANERSTPVRSSTAGAVAVRRWWPSASLWKQAWWLIGAWVS